MDRYAYLRDVSLTNLDNILKNVCIVREIIVDDSKSKEETIDQTILVSRTCLVERSERF